MSQKEPTLTMPIAMFDAVEAQRDKLRKFAILIMDELNESVDICGGDVEDFAERCGLIEKVEVYEPCGDICQCEEYMANGVTIYCNKRTELIQEDLKSMFKGEI